MKITGICAISKDQSTNNPKLEFGKTLSGSELVKGSVYWISSGKDEKKAYSNIKFVAYKNMVNFFRDNPNELIEINNAILKSYSGEKKDGIKYYGHEIIIFDAQVFQKKVSAQSFHDPERKFNNDLDFDDSIPF